MGDTIADPSQEGVEEQAVSALMAEEVISTMSVLPERERHIIELLYGLAGNNPCTLADVGRSMGISRERARQLEERGLRLL